MFKSKVKGKIEFIENQLTNKEKKLSEIQNELKNYELDELNIQIEDLSGVIEQVNRDVLEEEKKRQERNPV